MGWKDSFAFLSEPSDVYEKEIKGQTLRFYPLSMGALFSLRSLTGTLAKALSVLFRDSSKDVAQEQIQDGERSEIRIQAIDPKLSEQLAKGREEALGKLMDLLTNQDTAMVIGRLLFDSLRDLRPENYTNKDALEFVRSMDLDTLKEMLMGLAKANGGIFGPLVSGLPLMDGLNNLVTEEVKEDEEAPKAE